MVERRTFEAAIYNKRVRSRVQQGGSGGDLAKEWADVHFIQITAYSESEARSRLASRYPADAGYVISDIVPLPEVV